jgi:hypothetical protein
MKTCAPLRLVRRIGGSCPSTVTCNSWEASASFRHRRAGRFRRRRQQVEASGKQLANVEDTLEKALTVAGNCNLHYQAAPDFVRRQIDHGFFEKLWIGKDGSVECYALTEPFAALRGRGSGDSIGHSSTAARGWSPGRRG